MCAARGDVTSLDFALFVTFYVMTALGISAGYHRYFTHRSYKAARVVKWLFGMLGSMAAQGPLLFWVAAHRHHHDDSDGAADPHSPHRTGGQELGGLVGFVHGHVGWMFQHEPEDWSYVPICSGTEIHGA